MPWTIDDDLEKYKKGMTAKQKEQWLAIANNTLATCEGDPKECEAKAIKMANGSIKESITGDIVMLIESEDKGVVPIKVIKPGWGSTGYYPEAVLKRDGPKVFVKGTKMYWDHPKESDLPERSLRDLAGELVEDAKWKDSGLYGAGLYASAKVFKPFQDAVKELTPHIGVSIRASGIAENGEADGRKGTIIEEITDAASVDFVTVPGAGGKVCEIFESYRNPDSIQRSNEMEELKKLQESHEDLIAKLDAASTALKTANAELEKVKGESVKKDEELSTVKAELAKQSEAMLLKQAVTFVESKLKDTELPDITKARLTESLGKVPVLTEDKKLDEVKFAEVIEKTVAGEKEYLAKIVGSGKITGMGESTEDKEVHTQLVESFTNMYLKQGLSKEEAERRAKISAGV